MEIPGKPSSSHAKKKMQESRLELCSVEDCADYAMIHLAVCCEHANLPIINFGMASDAWMRNKKRQGSMYVYVCGVTKSNGTVCKRKIYQNQTSYKFNQTCRGHSSKPHL